MRKITVLLIIILTVAWSGVARAQLSFNADFARDGIYDTTWPMKVGEVATVDIYVSNVPEPGLITMGFKLTYDSDKFLVESAGVDEVNWPYPEEGFVDVSNPGEILLGGFRLAGLFGNNIRLGTVTFRCIGVGQSEFKLLDRDGDWFVLDDETVLDGDIGTGAPLVTIRPPIPADANGNGAVDLADAILVLQMLAQVQQSYVHVNADINGDGVIGIQEAIYILQKISVLR